MNAVSMQWLKDASIDPGAEESRAIMTLAGGALSPAHFHANCTEIIELLDGAAELHREGVRLNLVKGEKHLIDAGSAHQLSNPGSEPAVLSLNYSSGARDYTPI